MKKIIVALMLFLLSACAAPQRADFPKPTDTPLVLPTRMAFPTRIPSLSTLVTPTPQPGLLEGVRFVTEFSTNMEDWQVVPGSVTAAQINAEVARREGDEMHRVNQKVMNGFLQLPGTQIGGQVFETLVPAEVVGIKLKELKVKSVGQMPVLATYGIMLEDYYAMNFPDVVEKWRLQGAEYEDFKYATILTVSWATKYGPLRVSYMLSGRYIMENGRHPGRVDFLKTCAYESTKPHYTPTGKLSVNSYPAPIVGLSGTTLQGVSGVMQSDAFGWTPMVDFAFAQKDVLSLIAQTVSGIPIESKETLAKFQAMFDRLFVPMHCADVPFG